eukprot:UN24946
MQGDSYGTVLVGQEVYKIPRDEKLQKDGKGELAYITSVPGKDFKQIISYVPKYENHLATLTVEESVLTSYRLRTSDNVSSEQLFLRMILVLRVFGILKVRKSLVGNASVRGISGGERRRLTFCQEVGGLSSIILADLPTNGLDSATAYQLCKTMRVVVEKLR